MAAMICAGLSTFMLELCVGTQLLLKNLLGASEQNDSLKCLYLIKEYGVDLLLYIQTNFISLLNVGRTTADMNCS